VTPDQLLSDIGERLADEIEIALGPWVVKSITTVFEAWHGEMTSTAAADAAAAAAAVTDDLVPRLRQLLAADVDDQWTNPLQLIRGSVSHVTDALSRLGVGEVVRDDFAERTAPSDVYGLEPARFADVDASLHEIGLAWGAAKAKAHIARRRAE